MLGIDGRVFSRPPQNKIWQLLYKTAKYQLYNIPYKSLRGFISWILLQYFAQRSRLHDRTRGEETLFL